MQLSCAFLVFICLSYASAKSVFNGVEEHNEWPRLLNIEDTRTDGISQEINRALVADHLKATSHTNTLEGSHGTTLEDLMKPGLQHISLSYWNEWSCRRTDYFLRILNDTDISKKSKWIIDVRGMWRFEGNIILLTRIIRTLPTIAEFHWDTQRLIPAIILKNLEKYHPECRLYYTIAFNAFDVSSGSQTPQRFPFNLDNSRTEQNIMRMTEMQQVLQDTTPDKILGSKNLYSLKARVDHELLWAAEKMDLIHQILIGCPNIRELDLKIDQPKCPGDRPIPEGCHRDPRRTEKMAFDFSKYDWMLPPLEVLKLDGYRFDFAVDGSVVPHSLEPDTNFAMANMREWFKHMDWTHVHTFHLSIALTQELKPLADTLPCLRHFHVDGGPINHIRAPIVRVLGVVSPLLSLEIQEAGLSHLDPLLDVIETNHTTLRSFKFNRLKDGPYPQGPGMSFSPEMFQHHEDMLLSPTQLIRLFKICPDLQSLDLDMPTRSEWKYEILDTLLSFPQLKELTLRFPPEHGDAVFEDRFIMRTLPRKTEIEIAMRGVRAYLRKEKEKRGNGEGFRVLRTFMGWHEFSDRGEVEKGSDFMM